MLLFHIAGIVKIHLNEIVNTYYFCSGFVLVSYMLLFILFFVTVYIIFVTVYIIFVLFIFVIIIYYFCSGFVLVSYMLLFHSAGIVKIHLNEIVNTYYFCSA